MKVLQFACTNGKGIKTTSKLRPTSILKSRQNRCENNAQKSDAKMMERWSKTDPKKLPNREKYVKDTSKHLCQSMTPKVDTRRYYGAEVGGLPFNTNNIKPTVNISTVNIPTVNMPTVNKKQTNKNTPLARHSRKRGGGYMNIFLKQFSKVWKYLFLLSIVQIRGWYALYRIEDTKLVYAISRKCVFGWKT